MRHSFSQVIAEALMSNTTMMRVDLHNSDMGPEGAKAGCSQQKVSTVFIAPIQRHTNQKKVGIFGFSRLAHPSFFQAIAEALRYNRTLTHIDLSDNNIGPEGAKVRPGFA